MDFRGTARFRIERQIGSGGMGVVYEATDTERGARVALKTLRNLDATSLLRFKTEFRALADILHPNLVRFGELLAHQGQYFFTMELLDGGDFLSWVRPGIESDSIAPDAPTERLLAAETLPAAWDPRGSVASASRTGTLDEARLRDALAQLARGLTTIHAAGKVHRDVKPTNVIVTKEGRVVLVDFGLVADVQAAAAPGEGIAGTVAYMAPEQAEDARIGPASDWYAVGVMLYEALTGQLPFHGSAYEVLVTKKTAVPPSPRDVAPSAPEDLDALCMDLLQPDPAARPDDDEVLRRLGLTPLRASLVPSAVAPPFIGRRAELEQLGRAYESVKEGEAVIVYVHGESGLGKTALVRHFADELARANPDVVVLKGRCYERESVPYKAIDGVIDSLGRFLSGMPRGEMRAMLPASSALLGRAFPVLERLKTLAPSGAGGPPSSTLDAIERRARVFWATRELFAILAQRHRLVVLIDDLQWADADSLQLLREVMRPPAPPLLLLATVRTESEAAPRATDGPPASLPQSRLNVGSSTMPGDVREVRLEPLPEDESRTLAHALLDQMTSPGQAPESTADAIVKEAAGHPLFIDELVRHAWLARRRGAHVRLEDALWARVQSAEDAERRLLEVLSVARGPLAHAVATRACGLETAAQLDSIVAKLRFERLVRTTRSRGGTAVEVYHDRVRRAVVAHLQAPEPEIHGVIARALEEEATGVPPDLEALAEHWCGAGDLRKASGYALRAADEASAQLAFDRAARLYRWALDLDPRSSTLELQVSLASAYASAGRGQDAAEAYLAGAALASGDRARELRRRAAHHLLTSGHTHTGMVVLEEVMRELDIELPRSTQAALRSLAVKRAWLRLRGLSFRKRPADRVPPRDLARVDVCFTVAVGLAFADTLRAAEVQTRGLLLALSAGEPFRVVRALANEAAYVAVLGEQTRPRWEALLSKARQVEVGLNDPRARAHILGAEGLALHLCGYWLAAHGRCVETAALLREHAPANTWEIDTVTMYSLRSLFMLGHLGALKRELLARLAEAEARGDLFAQNSLRTGHLNALWLASGDVDGARREIHTAARESQEGAMHLPQLQELLARTQIDLYEGDGARAHTRTLEAWRGVEDSQLLRIQHDRIVLFALRARAAIAHARAARGRARSLLDEAAGMSNEVARIGAPWALAEAAMLRGCVAQALGEPQRAAVSFDQAARDYAACDMALHVAVARLRMGKLVGGDEGRVAVTQSREWMTEQGIIEPEAFAAVIAP